MNDRPTKPVIAAVILAAGTSSRFGATKLVAPFRGKPLVQHALLAARDACNGPTCLVVGHDQDTILTAASALSDQIVINREFREGIGSSIAAGVRSCCESADAILIVLADQPLITAEHLQNVITTWCGSPDEIITSAFDDVLGPPALFASGTFDQLRDLTGDQGAKHLLSDSRYSIKPLACPAARFDVDVPDDLDSLPAT